MGSVQPAEEPKPIQSATHTHTFTHTHLHTHTPATYRKKRVKKKQTKNSQDTGMQTFSDTLIFMTL